MNRRLRSLPRLVAIGSALAAAAACGAAVPHAVHPVPEHSYRSGLTASFAEFDSNSDRLLTRDELPADHELARRFADFDLDGDAALSRSEFEIYLRGPRTAAAEPEPADEED